MNRRLYRSVDDRILAGVAGGIAETYDFDPALVRVAWALLILFSGGLFLILYVIMALVIPLAPDSLPAAGAPFGGQPADELTQADHDPAAMAAAPTGAAYLSERQARRARRREQGPGNDMAGPVVFGLILILAGAFLLLRQYVPAIDWGQLWPLILIAIGGVLLLVAVARPGGSK